MGTSQMLHMEGPRISGESMGKGQKEVQFWLCFSSRDEEKKYQRVRTCPLRASHCSKHLARTGSFSPYNTPGRWILS